MKSKRRKSYFRWWDEFTMRLQWVVKKWLKSSLYWSPRTSFNSTSTNHYWQKSLNDCEINPKTFEKQQWNWSMRLSTFIRPSLTLKMDFNLLKRSFDNMRLIMRSWRNALRLLKESNWKPKIWNLILKLRIRTKVLNRSTTWSSNCQNFNKYRLNTRRLRNKKCNMKK